jgi:hypothetical protein
VDEAPTPDGDDVNSVGAGADEEAKSCRPGSDLCDTEEGNSWCPGSNRCDNGVKESLGNIVTGSVVDATAESPGKGVGITSKM